jgi:hypothetical protein
MADLHAPDVTYRTSNDPPAREPGFSGTGPAARKAESVRAEAGEMWSGAKDRARSALDDQQKSAAAGIEDLAGALRTAAQELEAKHSTTAAHFGQRAADSLQKFAGTLRERDAGSLIRDLESFARQQPAVFLGAAVTLGFLAMRFLKSSSEPHDRTGTSGWSEDPAKPPVSTYTANMEGEMHGHGYDA